MPEWVPRRHGNRTRLVGKDGGGVAHRVTSARPVGETEERRNRCVPKQPSIIPGHIDAGADAQDAVA